MLLLISSIDSDSSLILDSYITSQRGPLEVNLMVGEYHVLRSIVEYSIPRLTGWAPMMEHSLQQALQQSTAQSGISSPHNYQMDPQQGKRSGGGGSGRDVPF